VPQRWKLAVIGILAVGATTTASTLTTAYLMRPPTATAPALQPPSALELPPTAQDPPLAPIVRITPPRRHPLPAHTASPPRSPADEVVSVP
jgi:hypothetical protein